MLHLHRDARRVQPPDRSPGGRELADDGAPRASPPLLRRFVDVVNELNGAETAAPELVPSKAPREGVAAASRKVRAR